ncbi:hypothetical protein PR048_025659 [Dryococelus australis]|uniref:Uncharacterized protein n=1 Tax=Dryococelus australis TaxID=614101 RepID=A0ABQ9GJ53_9NEOP|nr:hypothetical protein PR048_025659 [Dryococelus australis]
MEQRRNEGVGETGEPRENLMTSGIGGRNLGVTPPETEPCWVRAISIGAKSSQGGRSDTAIRCALIYIISIAFLSAFARRKRPNNAISLARVMGLHTTLLRPGVNEGRLTSSSRTSHYGCSPSSFPGQVTKNGERPAAMLKPSVECWQIGGTQARGTSHYGVTFVGQ